LRDVIAAGVTAADAFGRGVAAFGRFGADGGFAAATISLGVFSSAFLGAVARFCDIVFFADFFEGFFEGFLAACFAVDFFAAFFAVFFTDFLATFFGALSDFFTTRFLAAAFLATRAGEDFRALAFFFLEVFLAFATTNFL
jgi:hypothetical protein